MKSTTYKSPPSAICTLLALGVISFLPYVQAANAACMLDWGWSYSSKAQNPCQVAASLEGSCFGRPNFEIQPLLPENFYVKPRQGTPLRKKCCCNTVIFSLLMACTLCQNSTNTRTWTGWSEFCDNKQVTQYPFDIPQGSTVPHWAYLDYTKENEFNPKFAESIGRDPEATHTGASTTNSPPTATDTSSIDDQEGSDSGSTRNVGAIAGGVIGGVAGLVCIAALVFFFLRRRRRGTQEAPAVDLDLATGGQWETTAMGNTREAQRLYDPSDPSTFPVPAPAVGEGHMLSQVYTTSPNHGKYTGNAEF